MADVGEYYTLPVILSMKGIDKQVNTSLGKAFQGAGAKGGKEIAAGLKSSEADIKRAFDNHAKLADKAADATGKLKVAQAGYDEVVKKGVTEGKRYEAALAAKNKATRDETRAVKTATDALRDYEQASKNASAAGEKTSAGFLSGLRGAASGAGSAGSEAASGFAEGFAGSSALLRLGSAGGPAGLAITAAGVVLGGLLWKNIEAGVEREPGRDLIRARLGATEEEMKVIGKASGAAYANNFGDSLEQNFQASQFAIQGGLVADAFDPMLQNVTEKLSAISSLVGSELSETTKSASILLRSGMAKSADEAFDIIVKGYQVTGDLGADWLDSIGEYSSGWQNAGLTAQQALALIKQAQDNGVDVTDRSADALREFGRRITEEGPKMVKILDALGLNGQEMYDKFKKGGPEAFQAFDQVFDKIRSMKDPVDRNQAALALLGDTAGDFVGAFAKWDPSAAVDSLGSVEGAAQAASDTMGDNVVGSFESAKRSIDVSLQGVQDKLAEAFGPSLQEAADWVKAHNEDITGFFVNMADIAISVSAEILDTVGGITEAFGQLVGGIGNVQGSVLKFEAWQADIRGDGELADELRRQSEEAYGWGDALEASGTSMRNAADDMEKWKRKLHEATDDSDDADKSVGNLGQSFGKLNEQVKALPPDLPPWMRDLATGTGGSPVGQNPLTGPLGLPSDGSLPGVPGIRPTGGGGRGVGINLQASQLPKGGAPVIPPGASREQVIAGLAARARAEGLTEAEVAGVLALAQTESNFDQTGFLGFSTKTVDTGYTGGASYANDFNKAMDQFFTNYKKGGLAQAGGPQAKDAAIQALNSGNTQAFLDWIQYGIQGAVPGAGGNYNHEFGPNIRKFYDQWSGGAAMPAGMPTGAPAPVGLPDVHGAHPQLAYALGVLQQLSPGLKLTAGMSDHDKDGGWHPKGQAIDIGGTPEQMAEASNWLLQYAPYIEELIHSGPGVTQNVKSGQVGPAIDMAGSVYNSGQAGYHGDHIHLAISDQQAQSFEAALSGGSVTPAALASQTISAGPNMYGPSGSSSQVNAFGADYQPGIGTPGYDEYGEPGYYETDPRRVAQANRSAEDSRQRIADTESAITDSDASLADAIAERDRIAKMTEVQRVTEGADLDKANADVERAQKQADRARLDATRAKEDAQWATDDLKEALQGNFKSAKSAKKPGKGSDASDLSGIGGILSSFLTETFGLDGSIFPDIGNLMPVKMAGTLLGALMPQDETGVTTSGGAFGMPDITAPPMPPDGVHPGTGAPPGPGGNTTIVNAGNTFNGQVGLSPADIEKQRQASVARAIPRIPIG